MEHTQRPAGRAHEQLPVGGGPVVESQPDPGQRRPDRARPRGPRIGERDDRTGLGQAVALDERHAPRVKKLGGPGLERRAARDAHPHAAAERRRQVGDLPRPHAALQPLVERGHAEDGRRRQGPARVEHPGPFGDDAEAAAAHQCRVEVAGAGQRMAHRQPREPHVVRVGQEGLARGPGVEGERPLRMEHAVGRAGRAAREEHRAAGVRVAGRHPAVQGRGHRGPVAAAATGRRLHDGRVDHHRRAAGATGRTPGHEAARREPAEQPVVLPRPRIGVERDVHDARQQAREIEDDPFHPVGQGMGEPVACPQTRGLEGLRQPQRRLRQLAPGPLPAPEGIDRRRPVVGVGEPPREHFDERCRRARRATGRRTADRGRLLHQDGFHGRLSRRVRRARRSPARGRCTSWPGPAACSCRAARAAAWWRSARRWHRADDRWRATRRGR